MGFGSLVEAKIIKSEFLNQAILGSEGPQLLEIDLEGSKAYLLSYNRLGQKPLIRSLSERDYRRYQSDMEKILQNAEEVNAKNSNEYCERELVYTKVINENEVTTDSLCWNRLGAQNRVLIGNWLTDLRRKF